MKENYNTKHYQFMAAKEQTFDEIIKDIQKRNFKPIYFLMGEEPYLLVRITALLIRPVLPEEERDFNQMGMIGRDRILTG